MKHCLEQKGKPQPICGHQTVRLSLTGCCPHYLFSAGGFWATVLCPFQVGPGWGSLAPDRFALLLHPVREGGRHPVRPWVTEALGQVEGVINSAAAPGQASRGRWQWVALKHGGTSPWSLPCTPQTLSTEWKMRTASHRSCWTLWYVCHSVTQKTGQTEFIFKRIYIRMGFQLSVKDRDPRPHWAYAALPVAPVDGC